MRKWLVGSLVITTVLSSLFSCQNTELYDKDKGDDEDLGKYLDRILEVESGVYAEEKKFNHRSLVEYCKCFADEKADKIWKATLCDKENSLEYWETIFYEIGDETMHCYAVDKDAGESILVDEDGQIRAYLCDFDSIDISPTATPDEIKPLLDEKLSRYVCVEDYEYANIPSLNDYSDGTFGIYSFLYYNMVGGYITDFVDVAVDDDGSLFALKIGGYCGEKLDFKVDKNFEDRMINLKLKDIYTTSTTEYISYNCNFTPRVVTYSGEPYVLYQVAARYFDRSLGEELSSWMNEILIPLDLITEK